MVLSIRKWFRRATFLLLLVMLTSVVYDGCRLVGKWITPADPYRIPQGQALKVFGQDGNEQPSPSISERLRLFYWYGE